MENCLKGRNRPFYVTDIHAHLDCLTPWEEKRISREEAERLAREEIDFRAGSGIQTFFSTGTPEEYEFLRPFRFGQPENPGKEAGLFLSFGIHPWYSDRYDPDGYLSYFRECDAVGEIGMDCVWSGIPLPVQRRVFLRQLQIAADLGKSIVLHTKGCEAEIGDRIQDFPGKILVHWYSGSEKDLDKFLAKDCYFSLGPDFPSALTSGSLYETMLREIPANRLFVETDGLSAVSWALHRPVDMGELPGILEKNRELAAKRKGMKMEMKVWEFLCEKFRG
ncbi:MAG: TatD family hydrolase [Clostridiales bacterium]|nr:TatD family hydrolase [Clostridiales bacterium]